MTTKVPSVVTQVHIHFEFGDLVEISCNRGQKKNGNFAHIS